MNAKTDSLTMEATGQLKVIYAVFFWDTQCS